MKPVPRLQALEFERLANQTRLGSKAREMARQTLVEGQSMHEVAQAFGTIPQRVRLAVGSIHRVQASLTWDSSSRAAAAVPDRLRLTLTEFIASVGAVNVTPVDDGVMADLWSLLNEARQRIARFSET